MHSPSASQPADLLQHVPLAPLTTLQVGGPAWGLMRVGSVGAVQQALAWASERGIPVGVLGGGSNVVISDAGFSGLVLQITDASVHIERAGDHVRIIAGAGMQWDALVKLSVAEGLGGLECLSGVPGWVGAAPVQNIGAYGACIGSVLESVYAVERAGGKAVRLPGGACGFAYRHSHFKAAWRERYVITAVAVRLPVARYGMVRYPALRAYLGMRSGGSAPSLATVRQAVIAIRRGKSMVVDPTDPNRRSVGSFFVNPVIDAMTLAHVEAAASSDQPVPYHKTAGGFKIPAAWLIEHAGLSRGAGDGAVGLSSSHALAIVNRGGATAADIIAFAQYVQARVRATFAITLQPEPTFFGFSVESSPL